MARRPIPTPLNRPMFRVRGQSRMPVGILNSGPGIRNAVLGAQSNQPAMNPFMMGENPVRASRVALEPKMNTTLNPEQAGAGNLIVGANTTDVTPPVAKPPVPDTTTMPIEAKDSTTQAFGEAYTSSVNKLRGAVSRLEQGMPTRDDEIIAGKSINQAYADLFAAADEEMPTMKDYSLSDYQDVAIEALGYDPEKGGPAGEATEARKTAFWMSVIKAGLATAAGESSDALTNIARGLSFGVDSFGKDLKDISAEERQANKDVAAMKLSFLKTDMDADIAKRANKIQKASMLVQAAESLRGEQLQMFKDRTEQAERFANLEIDLLKSIRQSNQSMEQLAFDKTKFNQTLKATLAGQTPDIIREMVAANYIQGVDGGDVDLSDPNSYEMTPAGLTFFQTYMEKKGAVKLTDIMNASDAAARTKTVSLLDFSHLGDKAGSVARDVALQVFKQGLSTDPLKQPAGLFGIGKMTGARSSAPEFIDYVINNEITSGVRYVGANNKEIKPNFSGGRMSRTDRAELKNQVQYLEFFQPGQLATPVDE